METENSSEELVLTKNTICEGTDAYFLEEFGVYMSGNQKNGPGIQNFRKRLKAFELKLNLVKINLSLEIQSLTCLDERRKLLLKEKSLKYYAPILRAMFSSQIFETKIENRRLNMFRLNKNDDFHSKSPFNTALPTELKQLIFSFAYNLFNYETIIDEYFNRAYVNEKIYDSNDKRGYFIRRTHFVPAVSCFTLKCNMMYSEFKGTYLHNAILPLIDPTVLSNIEKAVVEK